MPTWAELREYARSKYKLAKDEPDFFTLVFGFGDTRSQLILVRRFNAFDKEWIEFRSPICKEPALPHREALTKNLEFAVGAIGLEADGTYVLTYSLPLASMDPEEFELPLHVLAKTADTLEKSYAAADDF
jgi:hypothetical protein